MVPSLFVVDLITDKTTRRFEPAGRMASAIIEITRDTGGCLPQDLNEKGFTPEEVIDHWPLAKCLATLEMQQTHALPEKTKPLLRRK